MNATMLDPVLHTVIALGLLAAYATLKALGHDDTVLLGLLGGQLGGQGVSQIATKVAIARGAQPAVVAPAPTQTNG